MSNKHLTVIREDATGDVYAVCACGQNSGPNHFPKVQRWKADDWVREHMEQVEHALAVLHRSGSLRIERDHARAMLADPGTPEKDRAAWQVLFDGADRRLRDLGAPDATSDGLW